VLSQTTEYALRAIVFLASNDESAMTAQQVADGTKVPARYMSKVLQSLGKAGVVNAQRGLHGGFTLARSADQITILDVINVIDPLQRIERCPLGLTSHVKLCPLHRRIDEAVSYIEKVFDSTTIAELLAENSDSKPLCDTSGESRVEVTVSKGE